MFCLNLFLLRLLQKSMWEDESLFKFEFSSNPKSQVSRNQIVQTLGIAFSLLFFVSKLVNSSSFSLLFFESQLLNSS